MTLPHRPNAITEYAQACLVALGATDYGPYSVFQIAERSAELEASVTGVWPGGIGIDSFKDLVASKMVALVERGAPRDFLDVYIGHPHTSGPPGPSASAGEYRRSGSAPGVQ